MKTYKTIIFFALVVNLLIYGCGEESTAPVEIKAEPEKKFEGTIVAVGDSLTEGLGVEEESAYPAVLEKKLEAGIYISGNQRRQQR